MKDLESQERYVELRARGWKHVRVQVGATASPDPPRLNGSGARTVQVPVVRLKITCRISVLAGIIRLLHEPSTRGLRCFGFSGEAQFDSARIQNGTEDGHRLG